MPYLFERHLPLRAAPNRALPLATPRFALALALAASLLSGLTPLAASAPSDPTERDMALLKERYIAHWRQSAGAVAGQIAQAARLDAEGKWPDIDYANQTRSLWTTAAHLRRVYAMALSLRGLDADDARAPDLRQATLRALDYWLEHDFRNPNWWHNDIGTPGEMARTLLLLEEHLGWERLKRGLTIVGRARLSMTGQNLVWVAEITAMRGLLEGDADLVATALGRIAEEIHITEAEGIQADFSFHQHGPCLYSHGYGAAFAMDNARLAALMDGTAFAWPADKIDLISRLILDGHQWMQFGRQCDYGATGREIARKGKNGAYMEAVARQMLRVETGREDEFRALQNRAADRGEPALWGNRHFYRSDIMTHHRGTWYASARMFSNRLANTDGPHNSEGLLSHHIADGCNFLHVHGNEYRDIFPLWDWRKVPGTTVEQSPALEGDVRRMGASAFAGGVSDGQIGLAAFDLHRDALTARKAWAFFDDCYVALGAAVACDSERPVATTIDQKWLAGDIHIGRVSAGGAAPTRHEPPAHAIRLEPDAWVHHDRVAVGMFDGAVPLLTAGPRTGSWHPISNQYRDTPEQGEVFLLWMDHGARPEGGQYAYTVAPDRTLDEAAAFFENAPVSIAINTSATQAVYHDRLGALAVAFYEPGSVIVPGMVALAADIACLALVRKGEEEKEWILSVAQPENREATARLTVTVFQEEGESEQTHTVNLALPGGMNAGATAQVTIKMP